MVVTKGVVRKEQEDILFVKSLDKEIIYKLKKSNVLSRDDDIVEFDEANVEEGKYRFPEDYKHYPTDDKDKPYREKN